MPGHGQEVVVESEVVPKSYWLTRPFGSSGVSGCCGSSMLSDMTGCCAPLVALAWLSDFACFCGLLFHIVCVQKHQS